MGRYETMWIIALMLGALLMCAAPFARSQPAPWTEFMEDEHQLQMCSDAQEMLIVTKLQDEKIQSVLDQPGHSNATIQILKAEQKGLWQLEEDIKYWINTSCTKA